MKTNLKDLTDEQLLEYHSLFTKMSKRGIDVKINKMDSKFGYHVVRLLNEAEQVLMTADLDLTQNREQLKSIRRGEWKEEDIVKHFEEKEAQLEKLYITSKLRHSPDQAAIKQLLLNCLEQHYGDLSSCVVDVDKAMVSLQQIKEILDKAGI